MLALLPFAITLVLALTSTWIARTVARRYPQLRPLTYPFVASVAALAALGLIRTTVTGWLALAISLPLLVLAVRAIVLLFRALVFHSQGHAPPRLLENILAVALYGFGAVALARYSLGLELTPFLATSAVVGAVVGLALQDTLGNLFAGIALHTEAPFAAGDWIRLGEREGQVEQVSWRAMRLRTWYGDTLTVPNNDVARQTILNYSQPPGPHWRTITLGVGYAHPPDQVVETLRQAVASASSVPREPAARVRLLSFGDSAVQYEITYPTSSYADYRRIESDIQRLIWYHFKRRGVSIPFPIRTVQIERATAGSARREALLRLETVLQTIDIFRPLVDGELHFAAERFQHTHYAADETIIAEDVPGDSFFIIARGEVEIGRQQRESRRVIARLGEGQFFGEMALLTGQRRTATVVAATDVELFVIDKRGFQDILTHNPKIAEDISTILSERTEMLTQFVAEATDEIAPTSKEDLRERILTRMRRYFGLPASLGGRQNGKRPA
jgi:small-conductance mechanosensitive channel/CRP-like cAMP-binding protein